MNEIEKRLEKRLLAQQEAMQKVIAAYGMTGDPDRKIALLRQALEVDPSVYNGYVALGYAYWYEKGDLVAAEECFRKELDYHPDNYQAACDLAALYAEQQEWTAALSWMKEAVRIRPESAKDFDNDPRFDVLRANPARGLRKGAGALTDLSAADDHWTESNGRGYNNAVCVSNHGRTRICAAIDGV
ncbi:tetratricopeptide repeat protein [Kyrpidia sp.]|uniref:TPR end-of-group domain-containing protein n=1 Tax=Kyrpidia sp. TaxID=2073077 RepID=UPI00258A892C|nr:tetratricopeptide repeat protein [Kyrpidia sp.]MCL6576126.1 tetratricopeptide repeat protein [Kyrpidia sp.]